MTPCLCPRPFPGQATQHHPSCEHFVVKDNEVWPGDDLPPGAGPRHKIR